MRSKTDEPTVGPKYICLIPHCGFDLGFESSGLETLLFVLLGEYIKTQFRPRAG